MKQSDPRDVGKTRAETKRQQSACASPAAYDRLKNLLFDQAIGAHDGDRTNLDTLADYSVARMEKPVVKGWDPALDITRCEGRFVLEIPPGAERAFGGGPPCWSVAARLLFSPGLPEVSLDPERALVLFLPPLPLDSLTTPVTLMLLTRAALYRDRISGSGDVPLTDDDSN